ncbi:MAG: peptide-methionine (S)-S-oxide reductase MsrA [Leptospirillia bacterium]
MTHSPSLFASAMAFAASLGCFGEAPATPSLPSPDRDIPPSGTQTAVFAGGCFWGVEAVFRHVRGVVRSVSGYAGGEASTATYQQVCTGRTGHAEAVEVTFDSSVVSFGTLLRIFFSVIHDPTQKDRQGPDIGPQYRSAVFATSPLQEGVAREYIEKLNASGLFPKPLATVVAPLRAFYPAEPFHQNFLLKNPAHPYIVIHDLPKIAALKKHYPEIFQE